MPTLASSYSDPTGSDTKHRHNMTRLILALACLALALAASVAAAITSDEPTAEAVGYEPSAFQLQRIQSALSRVFAPGFIRLEPETPPSQPAQSEGRIRIRSAPSSPEVLEIGKLLGAFMSDDQQKEPRSVHGQQQQQAGDGGPKSQRNMQSVFMRNLLRFGKRSGL